MSPSDEICLEFNFVVRRILDRRGKSQHWLAHRMQRERHSIDRRLNGHVNWTLADLGQLAAALEIPLWVILREVERQAVLTLTRSQS